MTTGEKISKLRKESNMTQEQLADLMQVSRQSVSKWESDIAFPETEKLLHLGELFHCSIDYLLKENAERDGTKKEAPDEASTLTVSYPRFRQPYTYEYVSRRKLGNLPLVHVNIGRGRVAKGVVAVGFRSVGIFSVGLLSAGVLSFGLLSLGLLAFGVLSLGVAAFGSIAAGIFSFGAVALGALLAAGGIAVGTFACGGIAVGNYFAYGGYANAQVAIGLTHVKGDIWSYCGEALDFDRSEMIAKLKEVVPSALRWLANAVTAFV